MEWSKADRLATARAWTAMALGVALIVTQAASLGDPVWGSGTVIHFAAWWAWAAALSLFIVWGAGLFRGRALGALLNDEATIENRRRALGVGFWGAVIGAFLAYGATFYEHLAARDALRLVVTFAGAPALIRFALLELRGLRRE